MSRILFLAGFATIAVYTHKVMEKEQSKLSPQDFDKKAREILSEYTSLLESIEDRWRVLKLDEMKSTIASLSVQMEKPDFWDHPEMAARVSREKAALLKKVEPWEALRRESSDNLELANLAKEEKDEEILSNLETSYPDLKKEYDHQELFGALSAP